MLVTLAFMWRDISVLRDTNTEYHESIGYAIFFSEASTFRPPSDAQRFARNASSPRRPFILAMVRMYERPSSRPLYNFLFEEIDFQLALRSYSSAHDSPIRNFSPRKFVLASNEYLRLAVTAAVDSRVQLSMKGINFTTKRSKFKELMAIHFDAAVRYEVKKKSIIRCLARYFCLSVPFAFFTWKSGASRDAKPARLRRDKFPLFDVNMAEISTSGYPHRDDMRGPLGWKIPKGWLLLF